MLALQRRVVAAHQALQFGELADHLGDEVGLGEPRRALGESRIGADHGRQFAWPAPRCAPPARPACRASRGRRWIVSFSSRSSSRIFWSVSQKNLASDSRARTTRSLPPTIVRAAVAGLDVGGEDEAVGERDRLPSPLWGGAAGWGWRRQPGRGHPPLRPLRGHLPRKGGGRQSGWRSTKHFWLARMVARITSGGIARKPRRRRPSAPPAIRPGRPPPRAGPRPRPARARARRRGRGRRAG